MIPQTSAAILGGNVPATDTHTRIVEGVHRGVSQVLCHRRMTTGLIAGVDIVGCEKHIEGGQLVCIRPRSARM